MRILLLTQWFEPEPCFKGLQFAKALVQRGHSVEVLTGFPNYPGGKLYPGYRIRLWQRQSIEGIRVIRVPLIPSHSRSVVGRIGNYLSFACSAATLGLLLASKPDIVYVYHPPASIGLPALLFRYLRRAKVVYDIQDLWPDTLEATGMVNSSLLSYAMGKWCGHVYRGATQIVVLSPGFKRLLVARGVPERKVEVIYNWCDERNLAEVPPELGREEEDLLRGRFNILFAGNMGAAQGLHTVLSTAELVQESNPSIQFVFVGDGIEKPRLQDRARAAGLKNVCFLPRRSSREVQALYTRVDALLVHLKADCLFEVTIPSKTQAYLMAGRPIIMAVRGDAAELIRESGAGLCCDPSDPDQLARSVVQLAQLDAGCRARMGTSGREYYREYLSLDAGVRRFDSVFQRCRS